MKLISQGAKTKQGVIAEHIEKTREIYLQVTKMVDKMDEAMSRFFEPISAQLMADKNAEWIPFTVCGKCGNVMMLVVSTEKADGARGLRCTTCNESHNLPHKGELSPHEHKCPLCNFQVSLFL